MQATFAVDVNPITLVPPDGASADERRTARPHLDAGHAVACRAWWRRWWNGKNKWIERCRNKWLEIADKRLKVDDELELNGQTFNVTINNDPFPVIKNENSGISSVWNRAVADDRICFIANSNSRKCVIFDNAFRHCAAWAMTIHAVGVWRHKNTFYENGISPFRNKQCWLIAERGNTFIENATPLFGDMNPEIAIWYVGVVDSWICWLFYAYSLKGKCYLHVRKW